ncbi:Inositol 2-dehydrogenase/D-chiro-inositol 3-dehydrogenase [subsurface metagenome]
MNSSARSQLRLAIIGCGAVTERGHLPATVKLDRAQVTLLMDKNRSRAEELAGRFKVLHVANDYTQIFDQVDAAIVALPHHLHAPVSIEFLKRGVHVLVEKPMALNVAECDAIIEAAQQSGATLAVGIMRRFLPSYQFVKSAIDSDFLGRIDSFDIREGLVYRWPIASDFFFRKETAGGGVLVDTGAYTMDTVQWWFGNCKSLKYLDDSRGGVEANCEIHLQMESGTEGYIELSRTRNLRNTAIIRGERGTIEVSVRSSSISIHPNGLSGNVVGNVLEAQTTASKGESLVDLLEAEIEDWVEAITAKREPRVLGEEGRKSVALIEACYKNRKPLELPWLSPK